MSDTDSEGYTPYSQTSSGWKISYGPNKLPSQRWKIVHPEYGTRYFEHHDDILPWTCEHMVKQFTERFKL
jgi:hypothetical protein